MKTLKKLRTILKLIKCTVHNAQCTIVNGEGRIIVNCEL